MIDIDADINIEVKDEVVKIADFLSQIAYNDANGLRWPLGYFEDGCFMESQAYNIYSGNAGIILFLIEVYKLTKRKEYLEIIKKAKNTMLALCKSDKSYNYSFYKGKSGVIYTLLQIYLLTKDETILPQIEEMLNEKLSTFIHSKYVNDCLFEGRAGLLLVLNYLYAELKQEKIMELIHETLEVLVSNIKLHKAGVFWVQYELKAQQAIGFAYGTSGIFYALAEMRNIFGAEYLPFLRKQTNDFENSFWVEEKANWLTSDKGISNYNDFLLYKSKYSAGDIDFFNEQNKDISFLNGTIGICLSRLRAYELLEEKSIKDEIDRISQKLLVENEKIEDDSIASGKAGVLLFYIEASRVFNDNSFKGKLISEIENILKKMNQAASYSENNTNYGLVDGLAGIGFAFLQFINPTMDSIILPKPGKNFILNKKEFDAVETVDLKEYILAYNYSQLYYLADKIIQDEIQKYLQLNEFSQKSFFNYLNNCSRNIKGGEQLQDLLAFESQIVKLKDSLNSHVLKYIESCRANEKVEEILNLDNDSFLNLKLRVSKKLKVCKTKWDWSRTEENLKLIASDYTYLLIPESKNNIKKLRLKEEMDFRIIELFNQFRTVKSAINECFDVLHKIEKNCLEENAINRIRDFIYNGILIGY